MTDARLLAAIRRFWSESECTAAYQKIFAAYGARLDAVTVIIGKSSESESGQAQVVVGASDYLGWMDALETRLAEYAAEASGDGPLAETEHVNFGNRFSRT